MLPSVGVRQLLGDGAEWAALGVEAETACEAPEAPGTPAARRVLLTGAGGTHYPP